MKTPRRRTRSIVWSCFREIDAYKNIISARCKYCKNVYRSVNYSTSNLLKHMINAHPNEYNNLRRRSDSTNDVNHYDKHVTPDQYAAKYFDRVTYPGMVCCNMCSDVFLPKENNSKDHMLEHLYNRHRQIIDCSILSEKSKFLTPNTSSASHPYPEVTTKIENIYPSDEGEEENEVSISYVNRKKEEIPTSGNKLAGKLFRHNESHNDAENNNFIINPLNSSNHQHNNNSSDTQDETSSNIFGTSDCINTHLVAVPSNEDLNSLCIDSIDIGNNMGRAGVENSGKDEERLEAVNDDHEINEGGTGYSIDGIGEGSVGVLGPGDFKTKLQNRLDGNISMKMDFGSNNCSYSEESQSYTIQYKEKFRDEYTRGLGQAFVWRFFLRVSPTHSICNFCNKKLSQPPTSVCNLLKHLRNKHFELIKPTIDEIKTKEKMKLEKEEVNASMKNNSINFNGNTKIGEGQNASIKYTAKFKYDYMRRLGQAFVWRFFVRVSQLQSLCTFCKKKFNQQPSSVCNLLKHLRCKHFDLVKPTIDEIRKQERESQFERRDEIDGVIVNVVKKRAFNFSGDKIVESYPRYRNFPSSRRSSDKKKFFGKDFILQSFSRISYDSNKISCNHCQEVFKESSDYTSLLLKHMFVKHHSIYQQALLDNNYPGAGYRLKVPPAPNATDRNIHSLDKCDKEQMQLLNPHIKYDSTDSEHYIDDKNMSLSNSMNISQDQQSKMKDIWKQHCHLQAKEFEVDMVELKSKLQAKEADLRKMEVEVSFIKRLIRNKQLRRNAEIERQDKLSSMFTAEIAQSENQNNQECTDQNKKRKIAILKRSNSSMAERCDTPDNFKLIFNTSHVEKKNNTNYFEQENSSDHKQDNSKNINSNNNLINNNNFESISDKNVFTNNNNINFEQQIISPQMTSKSSSLGGRISFTREGLTKLNVSNNSNSSTYNNDGLVSGMVGQPDMVVNMDDFVVCNSNNVQEVDTLNGGQRYFIVNSQEY